MSGDLAVSDGEGKREESQRVCLEVISLRQSPTHTPLVLILMNYFCSWATSAGWGCSFRRHGRGCPASLRFRPPPNRWQQRRKGQLCSNPEEWWPIQCNNFRYCCYLLCPDFILLLISRICWLMFILITVLGWLSNLADCLLIVFALFIIGCILS